jgi:hypothetical protein
MVLGLHQTQRDRQGTGVRHHNTVRIFRRTGFHRLPTLGATAITFIMVAQSAVLIPPKQI